MNYLAIETSSALCGACIIEDTNLIDKLEIENGLTHSQNLMPLIQELLDKNNLNLANIDGFICDIGPGSFTGIRIGVATAKAFVDSFDNKQFTGVSSLEALAYNVNNNGLICSIIDCKNDNCYFALYKLENGLYSELISPTSASINEMCNTLINYFNNNSAENNINNNIDFTTNNNSTTNNNYSNNELKTYTNITFVGDGVYTYKNSIIDAITSIENKKMCYLFSVSNEINTYNLALAGINKITNKNTLELLPLYLKKPQAERILEEKEKTNSEKNNNISQNIDIPNNLENNKTNNIANQTEISEMTEANLNSLQNVLTTDFDEFWNYNVLKQEFSNETSKIFVATTKMSNETNSYSNNTNESPNTNNTAPTNEIVGFISVQIVLDEATITNIVTKKQNRNNGIGSSLLNYVINYCKSQNLKNITLEVNEKNENALKLYTKYSFIQTGLRKNYYNNTDNAVIMNLDLQ